MTRSLPRITERVVLPPALVVLAHALWSPEGARFAVAALERGDFPSDAAWQLLELLADESIPDVTCALERVGLEAPAVRPILWRAAEISIETLQRWPLEQLVRAFIAARAIDPAELEARSAETIAHLEQGAAA